MHRRVDDGGNSLFKDGSCFSCRSTRGKCIIFGEDGDEGGNECGGGGGVCGGGEGSHGFSGGGVGGGDGG